MALLVDQGMREGAAGLSSGLEYEVGGYAETERADRAGRTSSARYGGVYMSHIRDEADKSFDALQEAIAIGEGAHVAVQISHIKLGTVGVWRKAADGDRADRGARAARRRRDRRRVSLQRVELDDHGARARQAVRLPAERREGARRRRRRGQRADRPSRGASRVRVPHARRGGEGAAADAGRALHPDRQGRRRRRCLHVDGRRRHPRLLHAAVGDGGERRRHRARAIRAAPARSRACSAATSAISTG